MIRKQVLKNTPVRRGPRLDLESLATFEISSEDAEYPIEYALRDDEKSWRAAEDGKRDWRPFARTFSKVGARRRRLASPLATTNFEKPFGSFEATLSIGRHERLPAGRSSAV
jgi:hypothetical protein